MTGIAEKVRIVVKKKKVKGHAHHGGAWKVAYADFVTAMMALFIVLWLLTQADLQTRSQIARYFRDPGVLKGGAVTGVETSATKKIKVIGSTVNVVDAPMEEQARASEQRLLQSQGEKLQAALEEDARSSAELAALRESVQIQMTERGLLIDLVDDSGETLFDTSSSTLKPKLVALLKRVAAILGELPNPIEIGGHTDSQPFVAGSRKNNWDLSYERAAAAREVMANAGLRPGQIARVMAHADSDPLVPDDKRNPKNRRLSILAARRLPAPSEPVAPQP